MALSYGVKFKKLNFSGKVLVEKEGEVVFDRKYLRLKGKGANDHGEIVNFTDIKEVKAGKDEFVFNTFSSDKFVLSKFSGSLENFLDDFYHMKNEFFAENLFMKRGMLMGQFDCTAEVSGQTGPSLNKGKCVIQFYEESIMVIPVHADVFVIHLSFMKHHRFDEDEYVLNIETDSGAKVNISKLGSHFEDAQTTLEKCLEKMYQRVLNQLNNVLSGFSLAVLLKLAYAIRDGRAVLVNSLKKIDAALPSKVMELAFSGNPELEKKIQYLRSLDKEEQFFVGFSLQNVADSRDIRVRAWFLCALPSLNIMVMGISNNPTDQRVFFFRIVMEQGIASDKVEAKVLEINQCMVIFDYDLSPLLKNKEELRKTKYRVAILRMAFLRLFRRSFVGVSQAVDLERFKTDSDKFFSQAKILQRPQQRHRQIFRPTLK